MYRVCSNIDKWTVENILRKEKIKDKEGKISKETIYIHLNSLTS